MKMTRQFVNWNVSPKPDVFNVNQEVSRVAIAFSYSFSLVKREL